MPTMSLCTADLPECAYILRFVEFTKCPKRDPWSHRKFAVYHKYSVDPRKRCSTWILTGASQRTEACLERYVQGVDDLNTANPFELHILFIDIAIAAWRPCLADMIEEVAKLVRVHQGSLAVTDTCVVHQGRCDDDRR